MKIFITIVLSVLCLFGNAQSLEKKPCGTISKRSDWLKQYQANPSAFRNNAEEKIYVPLTIHIVGTDTGTGYFSISRLNASLCTLNSDFAQANIIFYIKGDIDYIPNSELFKHDSVRIGGRMMLANNVAETINCYVVDDPAGNCGYSLPYGGVAMAISCMGAADHTWSHEVGHYCSLPHPFLGWEGGVSWDNSIKPNYNHPAPEIVLYNYTDFKDQYFENDTLIIDTSYVEKVDGSNCHISADGFCDTKPDYLNFRWQCDENAQSSAVQLDPDSVAFQSDATLIMSYATDDCANRFSPEQIAAMRANILDVKGYGSFENEIEVKNIEGSTHAIAPTEDEEVPYHNVTLEWAPIKNADHYILQVSRYKSFSNLKVKETTSDPFFTIAKLKKEKKYYWRVYAYNNFSFCGEFSDVFTFRTSNLTANENVFSNHGFSIYPHLIRNHQNLTVNYTSESFSDINISIRNVAGVLVANRKEQAILGANHWQINLNYLASGIYFVSMRTSSGVVTERVILE